MSFAIAVPLIMGAGAAVSFGVSFAGTLVATPTVWKDKRQYRVTWIGDQVPRDEEAEAVWDAVVGRGLSTYGQITCHVADRLFRRDHVRAGWVSDVGVFESWYLVHACELVEWLDGSVVRIEAG